MIINKLTLRRNFQIGVGGPCYQVEIEASVDSSESLRTSALRLKAAIDQQIAPLFPGSDGSYGGSYGQINPH